jgi:hypothetical protein
MKGLTAQIGGKRLSAHFQETTADESTPRSWPTSATNIGYSRRPWRLDVTVVLFANAANSPYRCSL